MKTNILKSNSGMSLVEIIVALVLFGLGITMAMRTLPDSNYATNRGRNISKATQLAQEKIEQLMSIPYTDADLAAGAHTDPENPIESHFNRRWNVQVDTPMNDMKEVTVTVSFQTGSKDSTAVLTTYLTARR